MPTLPIVGAHFHPPAKGLLAVLPAGTDLRLVPEPDNAFDENAMRVELLSNNIPIPLHPNIQPHIEGYGFSLSDILGAEAWHLGYIPRVNAAELKLDGPVAGVLRFAADGKPQVQFSVEGPRPEPVE